MRLHSSRHEREGDSPSVATAYVVQEYGIVDDALVRAVSDHYPVFAEYRVTGPDDDEEEEVRWEP